MKILWHFIENIISLKTRIWMINALINADFGMINALINADSGMHEVSIAFEVKKAACVMVMFFFFFFSFFSCSGLWLPWWCLWLVVVVGCGCYNGSYGRWSRDSGGGGGGCYRFLCVFLIILISRQYNFKCSKNYRSFYVGCILKWGGIIDKVGF